MKTYKSQCAIDAQTSGYGDKSYWDYLDQHAQELYDKLVQKDNSKAKLMLTRSLSEALQGNDGN